MAYDKSHEAKIKRQKKKPKKITESYLHNSGLYYLERFAASKAHFQSVMTRKVKRSCMVHPEQDFDKCAEMVIALADKFERVGLLDDESYTRGRVGSLRRKGLSKSVIVQKMHIKGIAREHTLTALQALDDETYDDERDAEIAAALRLARKKRLGPYRRDMQEVDDDGKSARRALGVFARAGFSYDIAKTVLDMSADEINEY